MLASLLLALAAPAPQDADPLAPARQGKLRCIAPDVRAHSCGTIVQYTVQPDGRYDAVVRGVVQTEPLIAIEYKLAGQVEDGAVCATVRPADFTAGKLSKDGAPLVPAVESQIRQQLMLALQPLAGHKRCYRDRPDGDRVIGEVTIDGQPQGTMNQRAIWVKPEDGYALGL